MDFTEAFQRWVDLLNAEAAWKEGNRNPLEVLLDQPDMLEAFRGEEPATCA